MKQLFTICFSIFYLVNLYSQVIKCGHTHYENLLEEKYGLRSIKPQDVHTSHTRGGDLYRIPVVVHVVYNTPEENLSDELIRSQIQVLNEDFRRMNADAVNTREIFKNVSADAMIEFYLADTDPQGLPTNGITRTQTAKTSFLDIQLDPFTIIQAALACGLDLSNPEPTEEQIACLIEFLSENGLDINEVLTKLDDIKYTDKGGKDPWDQKRYMNIWVGDMSSDLLSGMPFLLGFAYPPVGAPLFPEDQLPPDYAKNDGIVIQYQVFGKNNPHAGDLAATNSSGRTCVHEVGHYLGLRHIWGDGDCTMDDGISDTPIMESQSQLQTFNSCDELLTKNTCNEGANDLPDMFENYMDYSPESCQNLFTQGQVNMMRAMLEGPRSELVGLNASVKNEIKKSYHTAYPNPTNGIVTFKNISKSSIITIRDINGHILLSVQNDSKVDLSPYHNGLYQYSIFDGVQQTNGKIIKQ